MEEEKHSNDRDVQYLVVKNEEILPEKQERSSSLSQEYPPEPAYIKEEQGDLLISQVRVQLQGAEGGDISMFTFTPVLVKSEEEDGEKPQTSQFDENQSEKSRDREDLKTEDEEEECGRSDGDRDFNPNRLTPDQTSHFSGSETDDSADWEESDEPQEGLNPQQNKNRPLSDMKCNGFSASESAPNCGQKKQQKKSKGEKPVCCTVCGKRYPDKTKLRLHVLRHSGEDRFSCSVCQKSFMWKVQMLSHMRVHTGEKPFSCSVCSKSFSCHGNLRKHSLIHTGEKPFSCSVCGKSFSFHASLKKHLLVHTGEKPFSCSVCGKSFSRNVHLRTHSVVHTGEKPFSCSVCGKSFSQLVNLKTHSVVHTGEKPFSCRVCDKTFTRLQSVKRHNCVSKGSKK